MKQNSSNESNNKLPFRSYNAERIRDVVLYRREEMPNACVSDLSFEISQGMEDVAMKSPSPQIVQRKTPPSTSSSNFDTFRPLTAPTNAVWWNNDFLSQNLGGATIGSAPSTQNVFDTYYNEETDVEDSISRESDFVQKSSSMVSLTNSYKELLCAKLAERGSPTELTRDLYQVRHQQQIEIIENLRQANLVKSASRIQFRPKGWSFDVNLDKSGDNEKHAPGGISYTIPNNISSVSKSVKKSTWPRFPHLGAIGSETCTLFNYSHINCKSEAVNRRSLGRMSPLVNIRECGNMGRRQRKAAERGQRARKIDKLIQVSHKTRPWKLEKLQKMRRLNKEKLQSARTSKDGRNSRQNML